MQIYTCSNQTFWVQIGINDILTHGPKVFTPKSWPNSPRECRQLLTSTPLESTTKIPGPQVFSPTIQSCGGELFFSNHHGCSRFVWHKIHKIHKEKSWPTALRFSLQSLRPPPPQSADSCWLQPHWNLQPRSQAPRFLALLFNLVEENFFFESSWLL